MPMNRGIPLAEFHKKSCIERYLRPDKREDIDLLEGLDEEYDLIVIGAGPSGLFCAINSSQKGKKTLILEKKKSPGHKLLISGQGHCNITNEAEIQTFLEHYGEHGRFLRPALLGFTNHDLIRFFEDRGLAMIREKRGKIFPETHRSRDVLEVLIRECEANNVRICYNQVVRSITKAEDKFNVHCIDRTYLSSDLVIATGGCSYPATGSNGDGYRFARDFGHSIAEVGPALTPVFIKNYPFRDLAGLSFPEMNISLYRHKKIRDQRGDILFTHQGLSGPGILDLSRYIRPADTLKLSFVPREKKGELEKWLQDRARLDGGIGLRSILAGLPNSVPLSPKLIKKILEISGIATDLSLAHLTREMRTHLIDNFTGLPLVVSKLGGFDISMVTRGGVELNQVNPKTMESRLVKRLYLIGEVLDVDGDSGGYNLQAAFSTGMLSARSIKNNWI